MNDNDIQRQINNLNNQINYYQSIIDRLEEILETPNIAIHRQEYIFKQIDENTTKMMPLIERRDYLQLYLQNRITLEHD